MLVFATHNKQVFQPTEANSYDYTISEEGY